MKEGLRLRFRLQRERCYLCGKPMTFPLGTKVRQHDATGDHVTPRRNSLGLSHNKAIAHFACNNKKQDRAPYPCELFFLTILNEMCNSVSAGEVTRATRLRRSPDGRLVWRTPEIDLLYKPRLALAMQEALDKKFRGGKSKSGDENA